MKATRRFLPLVLLLALCLGLAGTAAASESSDFSGLLTPKASYSSTQSFLSVLDELELPYEFLGLTEGGEEALVLSYPGDNLEDIVIDVFFGPDCDDVYLRCWNLIDFNSSDYTELLGKVNEFNDSYNFVTFVLDSADDSVKLKLDSLLPEDGGELCLSYVALLAHIADRAYPVLAPYAVN